MLLKNKTAIITGCNKGIGKSILETFAFNGANIIACVRKESESFNELIADIRNKNNIEITPLYFDLEDFDQVKAGVASIIALKKSVDILVNNAGIAVGSFFQMTPIRDLERIMKINFTSQILLSQGLSRYMAKQKKGSIINIASTAGILGDSGMLSYGSSKAALISATKIMAAELGQFNIRVNAVAPSVTKTEMYNQMEEKARIKLISSSFLQRAAEPDEVANVVLFLASDLSSFVNGQTIRIDGGMN
ncbi:MAG TPA: SDR family oxidoreductase [Sediminibacterium sp.]|uniref:SDR family NAD(P)-dependent oxidoreductase n=1 Tax=Sediminibacterium sp. TaxID=1917865 RepID=UPI0008AACC13|nr:SDR family oxidoreductase [Sediminibacterium sp.]OHC84535.1 MAG: short-chain dehydrogenase [Sphingobacteriia bacterium RIFOXYC2_FULL_35_18]OHC89047.1 MAG: short-chain dehydrogenase [Sphingobacteriia bacterium RIFOXYD2_FULL_35_12]HLD53085.1 SDR family oxidoreductase [Sediminibacterium sp.]